MLFALPLVATAAVSAHQWIANSNPVAMDLKSEIAAGAFEADYLDSMNDYLASEQDSGSVGESIALGAVSDGSSLPNTSALSMSSAALSSVALTGWSASQTVLEDLFQKAEEEYKLGSEKEVFNWQIEIHKKLKDAYFLKADKRDSDAFETSRVNMLLANPSGIYALSEYRYVKELSRFYSYGSGSDYALGAMYAAYDDKSKSASDIAKIGVKAGAEFDDSSGLPMNCFTVKLK